MPLTNAQNNAFFTEAAQIGINNATMAILNNKGISLASNLDEFKKGEVL